MSGGYFDYQQFKFNDISDELERLIRSNNDETTNEYGETIGRFYSEEIIDKFKTAYLFCRLAFVYAHRIDYLISCDDSEDSFLERLDEELSEVTDEFREFVEK